MGKEDLEELEEKHSEVKVQTEGEKDKQVNVILGPVEYAQLLEIVKWYRSPSITHAVRLMLEDVTKGLQTGEYTKMVRGE